MRAGRPRSQEMPITPPWRGSRRTGTGGVEWLDEVQRPPSRLPPEAPELPPLLIGPGGAPIRSRIRWESERRRIRRDWMRFLGPMPTDRPPLEMEVLQEEELDGGLGWRVGDVVELLE